MTFQEQLVELVDRALTRRQFLAKLGAAVLGSMAPYTVYSAEASSYCSGYYFVVCCTLCCPPSTSRLSLPPCTGNPTQRTAWCWTCQYGNSCYRCCEAHDPEPSQCGGCRQSKVFYSWYEQIYCPVSTEAVGRP